MFSGKASIHQINVGTIVATHDKGEEPSKDSSINTTAVKKVIERQDPYIRVSDGSKYTQEDENELFMTKFVEDLNNLESSPHVIRAVFNEHYANTRKHKLKKCYTDASAVLDESRSKLTDQFCKLLEEMGHNTADYDSHYQKHMNKLLFICDKLGIIHIADRGFREISHVEVFKQASEYLYDLPDFQSQETYLITYLCTVIYCLHPHRSGKDKERLYILFTNNLANGKRPLDAR